MVLIRSGTKTERNGMKFSFKDGKKEGLGTEWYENGKKRIEKHYKNGLKEGPWTEWSKEGKKTFEENFKNGNAI